MECTSVLAGLSETKEFWKSLDLLRYLLLIAGLDAVPGLYAANVTQRCETFTLPRCGYSQWYHRAMLRNSGALCLSLGIITGIACILAQNDFAAVLLAAGILALNLLVISNIQMFITMLSKNVSLGYLVCMLIQFVSIFCSERMPQAGKMLLIGNWGMMVRSSLAKADGIPIGTAVVLEICILIVLWIFGWRVIRRTRKGA